MKLKPFAGLNNPALAAARALELHGRKLVFATNLAAQVRMGSVGRN